MRKVVFVLSFIGFVAATVLAYVANVTEAPLPPAFAPASNPFPSGIFANGILESDQPSGSNVNVYPEVSGTVTRILVSEGQKVDAGAPLLLLEDSVQRATTEQLESQAQAALAQLEQLRAEPRPYPLLVWRNGQSLTLTAHLKLGPYATTNR